MSWFWIFSPFIFWAIAFIIYEAICELFRCIEKTFLFLIHPIKGLKKIFKTEVIEEVPLTDEEIEELEYRRY